MAVHASLPSIMPGKMSVDIVDRKRIVHTVIGNCAFRADRFAMPTFMLWITLATEQHNLAVLASRQ